MDDAVPRVQLKRVDPFYGLLIDADTWRDSHEYHRQAEQAHGLALHGWGIVAGLEVEEADPPDRSVWIRPGVAIDPAGRLILVAQPFRYKINTVDAGPVYLVLMFREIPTEPVPSLDDGTERPSRLLEAYAIYERDRLPDQPYVELARVQLKSGRGPVRTAKDPNLPAENEIDGRYREQAAIRPGPRATIGVWKAGDTPDALAHHLSGPARLLGAVTSGLEWRLRRRDQPHDDTPLDCDLLLMPIHSQVAPNEKERQLLISFLDAGGVLLAESCAAVESDGQRQLVALAQAVGRQPQPVKRDHPLLTAHHVFSAAPPGAGEGLIYESDGLILSSADYACAWNGGTPKNALSRDQIRTAVEFAENLLAYALARRVVARRAASRVIGGKA